MIYETGVKKVLESNSRIGAFEYIRLSNEFVSDKKNIESKYKYLISTLQKDYALLLDQMSL